MKGDNCFNGKSVITMFGINVKYSLILMSTVGFKWVDGVGYLALVPRVEQ